ncbi:MAG: hypothetical protein QOD26_2966 [Betaproteobacteria bacterium]|jgi:hypothetical protein|nr:hypothetical protein [Betaproteobacteria bacterium]
MALPARLRNSLALILALAGCGSTPPQQWQTDSAQAMASFQRAYLAGDSARAEAEFRAARADLASTGRADLVARAELVRCAARSASLEFDDCPGFEALRDGAGEAEQRYADYLAGKGRHSTSDDPLSRLVAASVRFRTGGIDPAEIARAVETASAQGWRRPLLAWLGVQLKRAEAAGDGETAARIRRRMALVSG